MRYITISLLSALSVVLAPHTHAESEPQFVDDWHVCAPDGVAVGGYDLVSYFVGTGPQPGLPDHAVKLDGLDYYFANPEHRAAFVAAPEKYLPKYRGWCSATLSMGQLACPDFTNYKIENGRLLLFERIGFSNGLDMWNADPVTASRNADHHYQRLLQEAQTKQTNE